MVWAIFVVLVILWILGLVSGNMPLADTSISFVSLQVSLERSGSFRAASRFDGKISCKGNNKKIDVQFPWSDKAVFRRRPGKEVTK